jgi:SulP family sulfate permease
MIDVTVGLAIENAIKDAYEANCEVFLLCPNQQTKEQLEKLHVIDLLSQENLFGFRYEALKHAVKQVQKSADQREQASNKADALSV